MADRPASLCSGGAGEILPSSPIGNFRFLQPYLSGLINGATPTVIYYKMRAPCADSPTGYITWINTTGDDAGRPSCGGGLQPSFIDDRYIVRNE